MRITSVTPMKDEGPFILEWLAYHRLIGFNDFIVFSNDCSDGTDKLLDRLDEMGLIRHLPNPSMYTKHGRHHWTVLNYVNHMGRLWSADWVFSFDVDEFLVVNTGDGTLQALFDRLPEAEVISVNQLNFGTNGQRTFTEDLQMERFTRCAPLVITEEGRAGRRGIKTLTSKGAGRSHMSNHSPRFEEDQAATVNWVNAAGKPMPMERRTTEIKALAGDGVSHELAQLNHYALRSAESFLTQAARGNANHPDKATDMRYWRRYDHNHEENHAIARWVDPVKAEIARLREDPEIDRLHRACVAAHKARIDALKQDEHYGELWKRTEAVHRRTWGAKDQA